MGSEGLEAPFPTYCNVPPFPSFSSLSPLPTTLQGQQVEGGFVVCLSAPCQKGATAPGGWGGLRVILEGFL